MFKTNSSFKYVRLYRPSTESFLTIALTAPMIEEMISYFVLALYPNWHIQAVSNKNEWNKQKRN